MRNADKVRCPSLAISSSLWFKVTALTHSRGSLYRSHHVITSRAQHVPRHELPRRMRWRRDLRLGGEDKRGWAETLAGISITIEFGNLNLTSPKTWGVKSCKRFNF